MDALLIILLALLVLSEFGRLLTGNTVSSLWIAELALVYWIAKRRGSKKPWAWAGIGFLAFCGIWFGSGFFGARSTQGQHEDDVVSALATFDPAAAGKMKALARTDEAKAQKISDATLGRALRAAPDEALVAYYAAQFQAMKPTTQEEVHRCAEWIAGSENAFDSDRNVKEATNHALAALFRAAAASPTPFVAPTQDKASALLEPIRRQVDPSGYFDDSAKLSRLPEKDQCQLYLNLMHEVTALPTSDAALLLRDMFLNSPAEAHPAPN